MWNSHLEGLRRLEIESCGLKPFENQADMNGNARWPDYLARRLAAAGRSDLSVANESISGNWSFHAVDFNAVAGGANPRASQ